MLHVVTHMQVLGATRAGKTVYVNELHRKWPGVSIYCDPKGQDPLWGLRIRDLGRLTSALMHSQKIVWEPPRTAIGGIDWSVASSQLVRLWGRIQVLSRRKPQTQPSVQLIFDELGKWAQDDDVEQVLEDIAERGLGLGARLVGCAQHPATLGTHMRNNLLTRVLYALGDEGERCIRNWGWPVQQLQPWIAKPYHFASYERSLGWRLHNPRPTAVLR
ncbi:MAG: hypothetical protein ABR586_01275 [Thermoplasmatota archaeon]